MTARDAAGNTSTDALTVTYNAPDSIAPVATITAPTSTTTYTTTASTLSVSGTASDAVGVTQVAWANNRGGSGTATGTTSWSISGITLQSGSNIITITAQDAAGNGGTDTLTVTYNVPDTTNPSVTISGPTSSATHAASATPMTVSGTASGQRRRDAGDLDERSGRQRYGDRHDDVDGQRDRAAERCERHHRDGA